MMKFRLHKGTLFGRVIEWKNWGSPEAAHRFWSIVLPAGLHTVGSLALGSGYHPQQAGSQAN